MEHADCDSSDEAEMNKLQRRSQTSKLVPAGVVGGSRGRPLVPGLGTEVSKGGRPPAGVLQEGVLVLRGDAARSVSTGTLDVRGVCRRCLRADCADAVISLTSAAGAG